MRTILFMTLLLCGCGYHGTDELDDQLTHYKTLHPEQGKKIETVRATLPLLEYHYITVVTQVDIPAGAIIKNADILPRRGEFWYTEEEYYAINLKQVIGHIAMKPIHAGSNVRLTDINP